MSYPRLSSPSGVAHPAVIDRRIGDLLRVGAIGVIPLLAALAIALEVPNPSLALLLAIVLGGLGILTLLLNSHLAFTVTLLVLYLGLLDGPIKLGTGGHEAASVVRDVLIFTVALGAVLRLLARRRPVRLPPMSAWVLAFVALVLIEAFNPSTNGILHVLGGFRQQLEWVPFFFFAYALMRSKERFRALFLIVGVIAVANAVVATYQTRLSPAQVASWGPGYRQRIFPTGPNGEKRGGRTYSSGEGVGKVRPFGLGSDSGFGGGVGVVALPFTLALLATWRSRRRWLAALLCLGALVAVATGLGRLQVAGAVIAVGAFALLSLSAGRRVTRPLAALLVVAALAIPLGAVFVSSEGSGTFSRYESISPEQASTSTLGYKQGTLSLIPHEHLGRSVRGRARQRGRGRRLRRQVDRTAGRTWGERGYAVQLRDRRTGVARPDPVGRADALPDRARGPPPATRQGRRVADRARRHVRAVHRTGLHGLRGTDHDERGARALLLVRGRRRGVLVRGPRPQRERTPSHA